jgi:hypothetical protein
VILVNVHQPDEAALTTAHNGKCGSKKAAVELLIALLAGDLPPVLPVRQRLDEP